MAAKGQPAAADVLLRLLAEHYWIARTETGEPFAVRKDVPSVMVRFRGHGGMREQLAAMAARTIGKVPSSNALADVLSMAEGIAMGNPPAAPSLRIARKAGDLYLDLGRADGAAVRLWPGGWQVVSSPPVLFARTALTAELPLPRDPWSGSLDGCRHLFNVGGPDEWALFIACRIASLMPGITHPIELVTGPAGSAKTSATRLMGDWVDPAPAMMPVPRDGRTWAAMAASRYCLPVDNVSWIPVWWSDLLCKAASGDGWVDRALYSDGDVFVARFRSVVILNGIELGALRGDLADRIVHHRLVQPDRYLSDQEVSAQWALAHPSALAWLLDRTAETMADMARVPQRGMNRLAVFEQIVDCIDARWGTRASRAWAQGRQDVLEDVAEGDEVAMAVTRAFAGPWSGTPSELLGVLTIQGGLEHKHRGMSGWTPRAISGAMERIQPALGALGWQVWTFRENSHGRGRKWAVVPPGWELNGDGSWHQVTHPDQAAL